MVYLRRKGRKTSFFGDLLRAGRVFFVLDFSGDGSVLGVVPGSGQDVLKGGII